MAPSPTTPYREIRALYDDKTIVVYQAYNLAIASAAIQSQSLNVSGFKTERMTWIKPSFHWMLYRSGWAQKPNQERILAIHLTREGWEKALRMSGDREDGACVRIQWDPERDVTFRPLAWRSIQVGLSGVAVTEGLLGDWIVKIEDFTVLAKEIGELVDEGRIDEAEGKFPPERSYEYLDEKTRSACQASPLPQEEV